VILSGHMDAINEVFIGLDTMINMGRIDELRGESCAPLESIS